MPDGAAVSVELRHIPHFPSVMKSVRSLIPGHWWLYVLHGPDNKLMVGEAATALTKTRLIRIDQVAPTVYRQSVAEVHSNGERRGRWAGSWYNRWLATPSFWQLFSQPWVLIFEADSVLCPSPTANIGAFLQYAYVGAPWDRHSCHLLRADNRIATPQRCVGNSGLSLWNKSRAEQIARHRGHTFLLQQYRQHVDLWASAELQTLWPQSVPTSELASRFSVETVYSGGYTPFGVHKPHLALSAPQLQELYWRCPAACLLSESILDKVAHMAPADREARLTSSRRLRSARLACAPQGGSANRSSASSLLASHRPAAAVLPSSLGLRSRLAGAGARAEGVGRTDSGTSCRGGFPSSHADGQVTAALHPGLVSGDFGGQGVGAQLQERLCAFALARMHNVSYVHQPFHVLAHQREPNLQARRELESLFGLEKLASWVVPAPLVPAVAQSCARFPRANSFPCVKAAQLCERDPQGRVPTSRCADTAVARKPAAPAAVLHCSMLEACRIPLDHLLPSLQAKASLGSLPPWMAGAFNIAVHVRRGDASHRVSSMTYFEVLVAQIEARRAQSTRDSAIKPVRIHVLTDASSNAGFEWCANKTSCKIHSDLGVADSIRTLALAQVLVCSNSAFSFVAGVYSRGEVHWPGKPYLPNPPLPSHWIVH